MKTIPLTKVKVPDALCLGSHHLMTNTTSNKWYIERSLGCCATIHVIGRASKRGTKFYYILKIVSTRAIIKIEGNGGGWFIICNRQGCALLIKETPPQVRPIGNTFVDKDCSEENA